MTHRALHLALLAPLLAPILAASLAAQQGPNQAEKARRRLGGFVLDKEGKPWIGAEVMLMSRPLPGNEWIGDPDRLSVISGKRGRFSAKVLRGREYHLWAVGSSTEQQYRTTYPLLGVLGGPVRLRERPGKHLQVAITIVADKRWKRPLQIKVTSAPSRLSLGERRVGDAYAVIPVSQAAEGGWLLPRLPWTEVTVEVQDARGIQLWAPMVNLAAAARRQGLDSQEGKPLVPGEMRERITDLGSSELRLPDYKLRQMIVKDPKGVPLRGVELGQRIRGMLLPVATSDAKGVLTTAIPIRSANHWDRIYRLRGDSRLVLINPGSIEMPAEATTGSGNRTPLLLGSRTKRERNLRSGKPHTGRLLLAPGRPWAHAWLKLSVLGVSQCPETVLLRTGADGRFRFSQRKPWILEGVIDDAAREALVGETGSTLATTALLASHLGGLPGAMGDVDLSALRRVEFVCERADGGPASFAHLDFFRHTGFNAIPPLVQARVDRKGRVAMLVGKCGDMLVLAQDSQGYGATRLLATETSGPTRLVLGGIRQIRGKLTLRSGNPAEGAWVRADQAQWNARIRRTGVHGVVRLNPGFHIGHRIQARADHQGRFTMWSLPEIEDVSVTTERIRGGGRTKHALSLGSDPHRVFEIIVD